MSICLFLAGLEHDGIAAEAHAFVKYMGNSYGMFSRLYVFKYCLAVGPDFTLEAVNQFIVFVYCQSGIVTGYSVPVFSAVGYLHG